jgi:hypothetical protein
MQKLTVLLELYQEHELSAHMSKEIYQLIKKNIIEMEFIRIIL